jgi:hypothetical protein
LWERLPKAAVGQLLCRLGWTSGLHCLRAKWAKWNIGSWRARTAKPGLPAGNSVAGRQLRAPLIRVRVGKPNIGLKSKLVYKVTNNLIDSII